MKFSWITSTTALAVLMAVSGSATPGLAKDITVGLSWNSKTQPLESAWEDYMKKEGERQGKAAGVNITWVINVANADPARQAANIEDLINKGVNVVIARAEDVQRSGPRSVLPRPRTFPSSPLIAPPKM